MPRKGLFRLRDWNDARILLACAREGSFAAAAEALGQDHKTIGRRVAELEAAMGRPLFHRKKSGARPTAVGETVIRKARAMADGAAQIEEVFDGLAELPEPTVRIAASEGLLTYTIRPALLGQSRTELPLDRRIVPGPLPRLAFSTTAAGADIAVEATSPDEMPTADRRGSRQIRKIGAMHFVPMAAKAFVKQPRIPSRFDELVGAPLLDIGIYGGIRALDPWNGVVSRAARVTTVPTTPNVRRPMLNGDGITIFGRHATLCDPRLRILDMPTPAMSVSLWLTAHQDALREPAVRLVYDLLARMFQSSPWFKA